MFGIAGPPGEVVDLNLWQAGAALRERAEADGSELARLREVLDPLEDALWAEADELVDRPDRWAGFHDGAWCEVAEAMWGLA
jgi:hypothetical protein